MRPRIAILSLLGVVMLAGVLSAPVQAHWADLAVAEIIVGERTVRVTLTFPTGLVAESDDDRNGQLSPEEIIAHRAALTVDLRDRIRLTNNGRPGVLTIAPAEGAASLDLNAGTHSTVQLTYAWSAPVQELGIHYGLFLPGVSTASCLATIVEAGRVRSFVFTPEQREFSFVVGRAAGWRQAASFVVLGTKHILTGYDHILFLLTLLMLGGSLRQLLKVVTAFTVAHSVTLSLAVLNVVVLPARLVESGIALSIAYVAAENLWRKDRSLQRRWLITFGFGLVHGLGFASILRDLHLARANLALSLVGFNLGVEIGQVTIVTTAFLGLLALRRVPWEAGIRRWISAGAMAAGLIWFVQRLSF